MGANPLLDFGDSSPENSLMHADATAKPDFSGWATRYNLTCTDGRTIVPDAFAHQDKIQVPLVWQHGHSDPENVLGHAVLEHRSGEGVYTFGYFNGTDAANHAKTLVEHDDIKSLSIFANQLVEKAKQVSHGVIRELSLVLAGANPGALIDNLELQHADGDTVTIEDEAIIYTGEPLKHGDESADKVDPPKDDESDDGPSVQDVYDAMNEEQKEAVHYMVGAALESNAGPKGNGNNPDDITHTSATGGDDNKEGRSMSRNVFETQNGKAGNGSAATDKKLELSHDAIKGIVADAQRQGSLKDAVEAYALKHGIDDIDLLFPQAQLITQTPDFLKRRTEWVASVINGVRSTPFSRIRSIVADITVEEARALGYIKGNLKKEEFFGLTRRITTPTTIYKRQNLDRDDVIDITDFDVVTWLKAEMRLMLDEEIARAVLIGDGRPVDSEDKIRDPAAASDGAGIRSILHDDDLYAPKVHIEDGVTLLDSHPTQVVDALLGAMPTYRGSGNPTLYTTLRTLTKILLARDSMGRRYYRTASDLASELGVNNIVPVEVMEATPYANLLGIIVNLTDYAVGADRGGEVSMFDNFDIDYNRFRYLIETRCSGGLTKIRSALVVDGANDVA